MKIDEIGKARFSQADLKEMALSCVEKIINARSGVEYFDEPFRHLVIDNFLDERMANACYANFPVPESDQWEKTSDADIEIKMRTKWSSEFDVPDGIVDTIRLLNSSLFLNAMAERIGIQKLMPDPYFSGGGLNVTVPGGLLDVHVDGNYHDASGLNRRVNAILYLNPDYKPEWGGQFGIYDDKGEECLKTVDPIFNRLVIFDTHDFSFHGLPNPLQFPEGTSRKSIILYYYTKDGRPFEHSAVHEPHSALWVKRNLLDKRGNKTRDFQ
ncbi:2OG-Fe(II) oxygenase [Herminiimonas arsenitoxidans]|uniref:2OG-Fe(II) oxygenase n=1 Tax=Herminiimonas arsenitoxidans TaxID=1809410 RepID=UPI0009F908DD|nr:2OG-Fe(II) oxygenase [Herminiimonas arsenitoxidans]